VPDAIQGSIQLQTVNSQSLDVSLNIRDVVHSAEE